MNKSKKNILVVCHDAGAAEIISAYVKKNAARYNFYCLVLGPAKKIFGKKGLARFIISKASGLKRLRQKGAVDALLCGTSWVSGTAREAVSKAKKEGIKSVVYLDHWTNYRERFGYPKKNWRQNLPDEIWAGDASAAALARRYFKPTICKLAPNEYFREIKIQYRAARKKIGKKGNDVLFMSEPMMLAHKTFYEPGYTFDEMAVLKKVLDTLAEKKVENSIVIGYHPAEKKDKYRALLARYKNKLRFRRQSGNRLEDLARAKLVIGRRSMALAIAALCGKKTISFIPDPKMSFPLPFKRIIRVRNIKQLKKAL